MKPLYIQVRLAATAVLAIGLCVPAQSQPGRAAPTLGEGPWDLETEAGAVHVSVLTRELESPWSLVFLPDGDMLLTERSGRLRVVRDGELDPAPIEGLPDMVVTGISGLFGLALHPEFEDNRLIYFAYAKPRPEDRDVMTLGVARARWDGSSSLGRVEEIFVAKDWYGSEMAAENGRCCGQGPASGSFGARIAFDEDNRLYVTSGDRNWGEKAQDPQSHLGKILRLDDDGSIPDDNPFIGMDAYLPEIYTLGHRNPTGLRFDPATGELWSTEFGPAGGDEVNRIEAGENYGWMLITQGEHYDGAEKALGSGGVEGYVDPVTWWPRGGNPGNLIVYRGEAFPEWRGDVFVATMSGRDLEPGLVRLVLDDDGKLVREERLLTELGTRMRDVIEAPDGRILVLTEASAFASPGAILVLEPGS